MPLNCSNIQSRMQSLKTLKDTFDIALENARINPSDASIQKARDYKKQLQSSLEALKQSLFQHCIQEKTLLNYPLFSDLIARNMSEIDERTKVYIGPLKTDLFKHILPTIEYIYLDYPEVRIYREDLEVGGHSVEVIKAMFTKKGFKIGDLANKILNTPIFKQSLYADPTCTELKPKENLDLIHITVKDLGFEDRATIKQIFSRAQALGLSLCPSSVGPYYRLKYTNQAFNDMRIMGMDAINIAGGQCVFRVEHDSDGLSLRNCWVDDDEFRVPLDWQFVFCVRSAKLDFVPAERDTTS